MSDLLCHRRISAVDAPVTCGGVCRKHGVSGATFYKWKAKYGGLEVSDGRRLKVLAEAMLDNVMLKDIAAKK
jgi:putative transposase